MRRAVHMQITTIGLDIRQEVFQVHGTRPRRSSSKSRSAAVRLLALFEALAPCLVGMEACATSHDWARELTKLGHEVRLMPAKDVKAYVNAVRTMPPTRRQSLRRRGARLDMGLAVHVPLI
jgi:transposase